MAVTVIATAGAANANAYCTLAEAETYQLTHPHATGWTGTDDAKNRAIVTATSLLNAHVDWDGYAATTTQALAWPRGGMVDRNGNSIDSDVVPQLLKDATAELARILLEGNRMADNTLETKQIRSMSVGPVAFTFGSGVAAKVIADSVFWMVRQWGSIRRRSPAMSQAVRA